MATVPAPPITVDRKTVEDAVAYGHCLEDPEVFQLYRMGEKLAHTIAYKPLKTNAIEKVYIAEIRKEIEHIVYKLAVDHKGLVGYILCPTEFPTELKNKIDLKIVFKGTDDLPSLLRDLTEAGGAGNESFHANKHRIIAQINQAIRELKTELRARSINLTDLELSITIAGHSLGGADAQRCLYILKEAIAENLNCPNIQNGVLETDRKELRNIVKLRLFTFNSTGVSLEDNQKSEAISGFITSIIEEQNSKPKEPPTKIKLKTEINIFYAAGDGVQQTGDTHILHRVSSKQALIRFIKAGNIHEGQHYVTSQAALRTFLNEMRKQLALQGLKNLAFMGTAGLLATYGLGISIWGGGFLSLIGNATLRAKDWLDMAAIAHSLLAGGRGTYVTHTYHYFQGDFNAVSDRPIDHSFKLWTNKTSKDHEDIQKQIGTKSTAANVAQTGISFGHRLICRRNLRSGFATKANAATAAAAAANSETPLTWQLNRYLSADSLRRYQSEKAEATRAAAATKAEEVRQTALAQAKITFL